MPPVKNVNKTTWFEFVAHALFDSWQSGTKKAGRHSTLTDLSFNVLFFFDWRILSQRNLYKENSVSLSSTPMVNRELRYSTQNRDPDS